MLKRILLAAVVISLAGMICCGEEIVDGKSAQSQNAESASAAQPADSPDLNVVLKTQAGAADGSSSQNASAVKESAEPQIAEAAVKTKVKFSDTVLIPAGEFWMGSPDGEGNPGEYPRHKIYLDAFRMDKYEVTAAQYRSFAEETKRAAAKQPSWSSDAHPVVNVDWNDAAAFCKWRGERLPTEAEWEKAARGGAETKYSFGDDADVLGDYGWYPADEKTASDAHPVGRKNPNQYGLYDMHGNVWEWCSDWYGEDYYKKSGKKNPQGPSSGRDRILRGGWLRSDGASSLRCAYRFRHLPNTKYFNFGFRCVK